MKSLVIFVLAAVLGTSAYSQIIPTACATQTFNISANTNFYDDGGIGGLPCTDGHANNFCNCNCETTTTICAPAGQTILVDFNSFAMFNTNSAFDWMKIYEGTGTGGTVLFDNDIGGPDNAPNGGTGTGYGDCGNDVPPSGFCSGTSNCLTFEFHASGVVNREGWDASVFVVSGTNCVMPITLSFFNAERNNDKVKLVWETTSEKSNKYFVVQRTSDLKTWKNIEKLETFENSKITKSYTVYDRLPLSGLSYYRLKQVDKTGFHTYSQVESIEMGHVESFAIHPNPAYTNFKVIGHLSKDVKIDLYNSIGEKIEAVMLKDNNALREFDISKLNAGIYYVIINKLGKISTHQLVVE